MLKRVSRGLLTAAAVPLALCSGVASENEKKLTAASISNLSKYKDLIVLPGSANPQLAKDIAKELGVELGHLETARLVLFYRAHNTKKT